MLKLRLCSRRCSLITRASRARRYVLSSVIYALQPLPIRGPLGSAWWADVNLTSVQSPDRAPDPEGFGFADGNFAIGARRTT